MKRLQVMIAKAAGRKIKCFEFDTTTEYAIVTFVDDPKRRELWNKDGTFAGLDKFSRKGR